MLYYLGKGTEFKKEDCKEYKKLDAALKAAAKDESLVVWDETGKVIGSLTDDIPEGALQTNPDGSVNTYDADGNKTGTVDAETLKEMTTVNDDVRDDLHRLWKVKSCVDTAARFNERTEEQKLQNRPQTRQKKEELSR